MKNRHCVGWSSTPKELNSCLCDLGSLKTRLSVFNFLRTKPLLVEFGILKFCLVDGWALEFLKTEFLLLGFGILEN